jgi:hypothetical protein
MQEHLNSSPGKNLVQVRGRSDCEQSSGRVSLVCDAVIGLSAPESLQRALQSRLCVVRSFARRSSSNYQLAQIRFQSLCQTNLCTPIYTYVLTAYLNCALNSRSLARIRLSVSETHMVDVERQAINFADVTSYNSVANVGAL